MQSWRNRMYSVDWCRIGASSCKLVQECIQDNLFHWLCSGPHHAPSSPWQPSSACWTHTSTWLRTGDQACRDCATCGCLTRMNRSTTSSGQRCVRAPCACAMIMPYHHAIPCTVIMPYHHAMPCHACFARPCYAMPCHDLLHNLQWTEVRAPCASMCDALHCTIIQLCPCHAARSMS
jgi:hypothetical protein